jgi:acyl carrier protein
VTKRDFLRHIEEVIDVGPNSLTGNEALSDLPWDSLAMVGFIAMVDEHLQAPLSTKKLAASKTVADLIALVGNQITPDTVTA